MRQVRLTVAQMMSLVVLVALAVAGVRLWLNARVGHATGPNGKPTTYINNTYGIMGCGGLPRAVLLGVTALFGRSGGKWRPFLVGFQVFDAAALVAILVFAAYMTEDLIQPGVLRIRRSLPRLLTRLDPAARIATYYAITATVLVSPQIVVASLGGVLLWARFHKRRGYRSTVEPLQLGHELIQFC